MHEPYPRNRVFSLFGGMSLSRISSLWSWKGWNRQNTS
jgi:hypothetical protein